MVIYAVLCDLASSPLYEINSFIKSVVILNKFIQIRLDLWAYKASSHKFIISTTWGPTGFWRLSVELPALLSSAEAHIVAGLAQVQGVDGQEMLQTDTIFPLSFL